MFDSNAPRASAGKPKIFSRINSILLIISGLTFLAIMHQAKYVSGIALRKSPQYVNRIHFQKGHASKEDTFFDSKKRVTEEQSVPLAMLAGALIAAGILVRRKRFTVVMLISVVFIIAFSGLD